MRYIIVIVFCLFSTLVQAEPLENYDITINNGVFSPQSIEVLAQKRFKISVSNIGTSPAEFENLSLRVEKVMGPNVSSFVVIHPLKQGTYHFIDEFHMDMQGFEIIVK